MTISLTKRAERNYKSIKDHILLEWGEKVAAAFEEKTIDFLDLLEDFPEIGPVEVKNKQVRGFQLTRHTRVFYRIKEKKIIILTFFDVRQNPKKKALVRHTVVRQGRLQPQSFRVCQFSGGCI